MTLEVNALSEGGFEAYVEVNGENIGYETDE